MTFSEEPQLIDLSKGKNLKEKLKIVNSAHVGANTNIEAVFDLILTTAVNKHMEQSELPANTLIISDMEFEGCTCGNASKGQYGYYRYSSLSSRLFDEISKRYQNAGYRMPRLIFWNVASRTGTIPVKENDMGVALVSGFSVNIAKMVMSDRLDPYECLLEAINAERYQPIEDAMRLIL